MVVKKKTTTPKEAAEKFVTVEQFKGLENSVNALVGMLERQMTATQSVQVAPVSAVEEELDREIMAAKPDQNPVNSAWLRAAEEILGDALDRVEQIQPEEGGNIVTIVIKKSHSNASKEYLEAMKEDRRSRDVTKTGTNGVKNWCKLIKANLARAK